MQTVHLYKASLRFASTCMVVEHKVATERNKKLTDKHPGGKSGPGPPRQVSQQVDICKDTDQRNKRSVWYRV